MLEELKSDKIINKLGGRFKLTALVQKRLAELMTGSRPLIENASGMTMMEIVLQEILQDKITMEGASPESRAAAEATEHTGFQNPSAFDDGDLE